MSLEQAQGVQFANWTRAAAFSSSPSLLEREGARASLAAPLVPVEVDGVGIGDVVAVDAPGLSGLATWRRFSTEDILAVGYGLEVGWVDAVPDTAEMVDFPSVWNGADEQFVGDAVNAPVAPFPWFGCYEDGSVPVIAKRAAPEPAAIGDLFCPVQKPFLECSPHG